MSRAAKAPAGARTRYAALDGLRALAVTLVFAFHGALASLPILLPHLDVVSHLDVGVEIFFVLSGFLIYRPFATAHLAGSAMPDLRSYARRRFFRIYPLFWLVLLVMSVLGAITIVGVRGFVLHATLTHTYFRNPGGAGLDQSWTLVVEVSFYAFAPLWSALLRTAFRRADPFRTEMIAAGLLVVVGYGAIWATRWTWLPAPLKVVPPSLPTLGAGMLLAVLAARARVSPRLAAALDRVAGPAEAWWLAGIGLYVLLSVVRPVDWFPLPIVTFGKVLQNWMQAPIAVLLVVPAVFGDASRGIVRRLLRARPVAYVGLISYGVYLWHFNLIKALPRSWLDDHGAVVAVGVLAVTFLASIAVAAATYRLLERPAMDYGRRRPPRLAAEGA